MKTLHKYINVPKDVVYISYRKKKVHKTYFQRLLSCMNRKKGFKAINCETCQVYFVSSFVGKIVFVPPLRILLIASTLVISYVVKNRIMKDNFQFAEHDYIHLYVDHFIFYMRNKK